MTDMQISSEHGFLQRPPTFKSVFAALTDSDFRLYERAPITRDEWATPVLSHQLLAIRYVIIGLWLFCSQI